jgi:acylphosphatase
MSETGKVRHETVHYSGRVQGVGFRYTTLMLARRYEVSGTVENLWDGRVRLEVEGAEEEVQAFLEVIAERMQDLVGKVDRVAELREPRYSGFTIRHNEA